MAAQRVIFTVDLDRLYFLMKATTIACFVGLAVILLGELLGWWNDWGQVGTVALSVIGVLLGFLTILFGATRPQLAVAVGGILESNRKHDITNSKLDQANGKLDQANGKLDDVVSVLRDIRDRLGGPPP